MARQFCRLREVHSLVYGRRAGSKNDCKNGHKLTASTRVGSQSRLMNYLGSKHAVKATILRWQPDRKSHIAFSANCSAGNQYPT